MSFIPVVLPFETMSDTTVDVDPVQVAYRKPLPPRVVCVVMLLVGFGAGVLFMLFAIILPDRSVVIQWHGASIIGLNADNSPIRTYMHC